jgi:hypothetical protein
MNDAVKKVADKYILPDGRNPISRRKLHPPSKTYEFNPILFDDVAKFILDQPKTFGREKAFSSLCKLFKLRPKDARVHVLAREKVRGRVW